MKASFCLLSLCAFTHFATAQCAFPAPPTTTACGSTGQIPLTSAGTSYGSTYYYSGTGTFTGLDINGGSLVVCGTLTLVSLNQWSGNIIIEPGATLTIDDSQSGAPSSIGTDIVNYGTLTIKAPGTYAVIYMNSPFWNYGIVNIQGSLTLSSGGFYNVSAASVLTVSGDLISTASVENNGTMAIDGQYTIDVSVCMGGGSTIATDSLLANGANLITVAASGTLTTATIGVTGIYNSNNNPLTNTANLDFCAGPAETNNGPFGTGNIGQATLQPNCASNVLSVGLLSFSAATTNGNTCVVTWSVATKSGITDFDLEYSSNALDYHSLAVIPTAKETYTTDLQADTWFRLRINKEDGAYSYSWIVPVHYQGQANSLSIQPNFITGNTLQIVTHMVAAQSGSLVVVDMMGIPLVRQEVQLGAGTGNITLSLPSAATGMYRLVFQGNGMTLNPQPFVVVK